MFVSCHSDTDDACMTEFTQGQIKRMKWAIEKYRPTLMKMIKRKLDILNLN
jgi:hypothetical protein